MIKRAILSILFLLISITSIKNSVMASTDLNTNTNYIDLGVLSSYTIPTGEDIYISRNYGKAEKVNSGTKVTRNGTYRVSIKDINKVIGFEIPYIKSNKIHNQEQFIDALYNAMLNRDKSLNLTLQGNYKGTKDMEHDKLSYIINDVSYSYPMSTYFGSNYIKGDGYITIEFHNESNLTDKQVLKATDKIEKNIINYINTLDLTLPDVELEKQVAYDLLKYIEYDDYSADVKRQPSSSHIQGLEDGDNLVTCAGYARTFMAIMNSLGIPTSIIRGTTEQGEHAWNIVNLEGDNYHVDLTWADSTEYLDKSYIEYINEKDDYMSLTHKWNRTAYPICNGVKYNNRYIFNMITLDEFLKSNNPTEHVNIIVNKQVNPKFSKEIANKLNKPITFFCIDKIGYSIIRLIS